MMRPWWDTGRKFADDSPGVLHVACEIAVLRGIHAVNPAAKNPNRSATGRYCGDVRR